MNSQLGTVKGEKPTAGSSLCPEGGDDIKAGCVEHMAHSGSPLSIGIFSINRFSSVSFFLKTGILSQTPLAQIDEDPPERLGNGPGLLPKFPRDPEGWLGPLAAWI